MEEGVRKTFESISTSSYFQQLNYVTLQQEVKESLNKLAQNPFFLFNLCMRKAAINCG